MANILNTKAAAYAAGIAVGGVVIYFAARALGGSVKKVAAGVVDSVASVNEGTPYEGTGPVGTLGHAVDKASGGLLSRFGSWLGISIYELTHKDPEL